MISFAMRHENKLLNWLTRMRTKFVEKMKTALIMNIRVCDWPYKSNKKNKRFQMIADVHNMTQTNIS